MYVWTLDIHCSFIVWLLELICEMQVIFLTMNLQDQDSPGI